MKAVTVHADATTASTRRAGAVSDFSQLVKARLTLLVLFTTAVGFYVAAPSPVNFGALFHAVFGTALAAASAAALNQWWERRADALMERTKTRPIPAGRMRAQHAFLIGIVLAVAGVGYLAIFSNFLAAVLAALTIVLYIFAYTPLKKISTANTLVGAIAGAIPPMVGWVAARGEITAGAWTLFVILFFWQMPHFFALAWIYRADYANAGFEMISSDDESAARSSSQSFLFCFLLLIFATLPAYVGATSAWYVPISLVLSGAFMVAAMQFHKRRTTAAARGLFIASITYLPLLLIALVLTKS
jgi:protoheme IX farnesyltransferase